MGQLFAVQIIYRGVFQKTLAKNITRGIVLAAHYEGKKGLSFGRYGDSPERNGIPANSFAIVAGDDLTLETGMAHYEPSQVDVAVVLDDTLCKGAEPWAWSGLEAVNRSIKPGGTLIVVSALDSQTLLGLIHRGEQPYRLAVLKGAASFSGMWVYKDDHTDVRVLGAIAAALPELMSFASLERYINEKLKNTLKLASARKAHERFAPVEVLPGQGNPEVPFHFELPAWQALREGVAIKGQPQGCGFYDPVTHQMGGFRPVRNDKFKKYSTRTLRPVINFEECTKCTFCWLNCPDGSIDVTPEGYYDINLESCCGCAICEAVCPVPNCIVMANEAEFSDNSSQWENFRKDKEAYSTRFKAIHPVEERSHGFRYRGQYQEQAAAALEAAQKA